MREVSQAKQSAAAARRPTRRRSPREQRKQQRHAAMQADLNLERVRQPRDDEPSSSQQPLPQQPKKPVDSSLGSAVPLPQSDYGIIGAAGPSDYASDASSSSPSHPPPQHQPPPPPPPPPAVTGSVASSIGAARRAKRRDEAARQGGGSGVAAAAASAASAATAKAAAAGGSGRRGDGYIARRGLLLRVLSRATRRVGWVTDRSWSIAKGWRGDTLSRQPR